MVTLFGKTVNLRRRPMKSLVLVYQERHMDPADFHKVARRIEAEADDITVFVTADSGKSGHIAEMAAKCPSLTMCPFPLVNYEPLRGRVYQGRTIGKIEQLEIFGMAGVSVPRWAVLDPDDTLDPDTWGPAVVIKPEYSLKGRGLRLVPTSEAGRYRAEAEREGRGTSLQRRQGRYIAQDFVRTGDPMAFFRVLSFFSRPLYCCLVSCPAPDEIADPDRLPKEGVSVAVNASDTLFRTLRKPKSVLDLARRAHDALPDRPVLGLDIVVDEKTGDPSVLEANPRGNVWHLSSKGGKKFQEKFGMDYYAQFDALSVISSALIRKTRAEAR